ncbi:Bet v1-like protein [Gymnopus androsaceus JB14]|uniref:Bet v1-like protein n=1 Tax=Gymnopus androsaceus JB14 TaxID=1447944 RepID=A0A6A4H183_9AGAR|nr:Bet v1-like protein [Gymnopus androsaceus JB14]
MPHEAPYTSYHHLLQQPPPLYLWIIVLRLAHAPLIDDHSLLKVKVVIEISGPSSGLRLNGVLQVIRELKEGQDLSSHVVSAESILPDVGSATDISVPSSSSIHGSAATSIASLSSTPPLICITAERTTEARGITITQVDSIDPTLVVYRAEATFVGVGLWDMYGAVVSPGARNYWDKPHDAVLLEDVNELMELWHLKTKPVWPINGRDSVVLKTVCKSPTTTIHVFSFSADDPHLFPHIPPLDPNIIRTQVDLRGWAIEALSPNTTLLTLLEQSDPKGWLNKTSIPTQMINALASIGEFAIKCGGPPIVTRLTGRSMSLRLVEEWLRIIAILQVVSLA